VSDGHVVEIHGHGSSCSFAGFFIPEIAKPRRKGHWHTCLSLSGNLEKLRGGRVGRLIIEKASELRVIDDYSGVTLDGVEVFLLEGVAGFRGNKHFPGKRDGAAGVLRGDGLLGSQSFIDADDEFGNVVEPGELRVVDNQLEKLAGIDVAMLALVFAALHVEKSLVEAEKGKAEREKLLTGGGIVVRGIQI